MATISLFTTAEHQYVIEDLTSQIDGHNLIFNTSFQYIPNSILVIYDGVTYTKNNDFIESGPQQITFFSGDPFPPIVGLPLSVTYMKL